MKKLLFRGPVLTASGYGVHSRQVLRSIVSSGLYEVHVDSTRWGETAFIDGKEVDWIKPFIAAKTVGGPYSLAVLVTIPNEFKREAPVTIGITAGIEVDRVSPEWLVKCNVEVDAVVVPSEHSRRAFSVAYESSDGKQLRLERPIYIVPESVDTEIYRSKITTSDYLDGAPAKNFVFAGLAFDKANGLDRKNATKLVEWFCRAFNGRSDVGLVLKTSIMNGSLIDFETLKKRVSEVKSSVIGDSKDPQIRIIHGRISEEEMSAIYNDDRVVAAVSVTHGEGYGLPLIEAAACGLPVIATDWSGHLDFLTIAGKKMFSPISFDLSEVPKECVWPGVIEQGTGWANPKEESFVVALNKSLELNVSSAPRNCDLLAEHIRQNYSVDSVSAKMNAVIETICNDVSKTRPQTRDDAVSVLRMQFPSGKDQVVVTMPMSAGDVYLASTLKTRLQAQYPTKKIILATLPQYREIAEGTWDEVIEWQQWMVDVSLLEDVFAYVYTPNLAIQMTGANWVRKGQGRNILQEMHVLCGFLDTDIDLPKMAAGETCTAVEQLVDLVKQNKKIVAIHTGAGKGQWSARSYRHWDDVVHNLKLAGLAVVQVGMSDDITVKSDVDLRGKTGYRQLPQALKNCSAFVGIDSFPMHVAAVHGVPTVALFGSSYPSSTGPLTGKKLTLLQTANRHGCDKACYKHECFVDKSDPCINEIDPKDVYTAVMGHLKLQQQMNWIEVQPSISGYTHVLNPRTFGYPFKESIRSMLGFCEEVIVVDGGSTDGSIDDLRELEESSGGKVKVIVRTWDPKEPAMDGMQKAFGRAMCSPDADFLWQQDADEVVHEEDYSKVIQLAKRVPADVKLVHLPVIELWGSPDKVRTDRHSWKWRLSRNDFRITHGIQKDARVIDGKTGRVHAKKGMSDGCEYIDVVTGDYVPHAGFYSGELEKLRQSNPAAYGEKMNEFFEKLPCVFHYSWCDLQRKIRNFRDFWDNQWSILHGETEPHQRFPDVKTDGDVISTSEMLRERGGEHGKAELFSLKRKQPVMMEEWTKDVVR